MKRLLFAGIIAALASTPSVAETRVDATGNTVPAQAVPGGDDYSGSTPQAVQAQVEAINNFIKNQGGGAIPAPDNSGDVIILED